jgi:hypothetical protein
MDSAGGKPSKQTPADRRLKRNRTLLKPPKDGHATVDRWAGRRLIAQAKQAKWNAQIEAAANQALANRKRRALAIARSPIGLTASGVPVDPFDDATWGQEVESTITPVVRGVFAEVTTDTARMLDLSDETIQSLPPLNLDARVAKMADWYAKLGADTSSALQDALTQSAALGESIPEAAARIDDVFGVASKRSETIARTELSAAANATALDYAHAVADGGIPLTKSWLAGNCDICLENEQDGAIGLDEAFSSGDDSPPAHPSCLAAGTLVDLKDGPLPIEKVVLGDMVWTRKGLRRVLAAGLTADDASVTTYMLSNGVAITATSDHPVWVNTRGFMPFGSTVSGDSLHARDEVEVWIVAESFDLEEHAVYNLTVEEVPEYFANGVLVHNCTCSIAVDPVEDAQTAGTGDA